MGSARRLVLAGILLALPLPRGLAQGVPIQPRMGEPLAGLDARARDAFVDGRAAFSRPITRAEGLGPVFNDDRCSDCHLLPAIGGSSTRTVTRFARAGDEMTDRGGSLLQFLALGPACEEFVPPDSQVRARRLTPHVFGAGLVERIADADLLARVTARPDGVASVARLVVPLEGGPPRVGRFGWKCQLATLRSFSADAARDEIGLTNALLPEESAPNGVPERAERCDLVEDPEDGPDARGRTLVARMTTFQRLLAPPPQTPRGGMRGEAVFEALGCEACHRRAFTLDDGTTLLPYSDFLLHDMGALSDGISQGPGTAHLMRTAPLWGLAQRSVMLHDGGSRGSWEQAVRDAIARHDGQAAPARERFARLDAEDAAALLAFLRSLGRAELDADRDHDVDLDDWPAVRAAVGGPRPIYGPDDPESFADVDRDGDVDLLDLSAWQRAFTGPRPRPSASPPGGEEGP